MTIAFILVVHRAEPSERPMLVIARHARDANAREGLCAVIRSVQCSKFFDRARQFLAAGTVGEGP